MAKRLNMLALALFVWALVIAPAIHLAAGHPCETDSDCSSESNAGHCPGHVPPAKHDATHCAICQLAHVPVLASAPVVFPVPDSIPVELPLVSFFAPAVPAACRLPFSCGPPA